MPSVSDLINAVISKRQELLPKFKEQARQLESLEVYLESLTAALDDFLKHEDNEAVRMASDEFKKTFSKDNLDQFKDIMQEVVERASRETVNIGVSGVARVGKSTLLQAISGLEDDQIPTGKTVPVTAVRSTIHYSKEKSCAELDMYSWQEFRTEVLKVYADELGIASIPSRPADVANWQLPDKPNDLLNRLKYIKGSFHSYEQYLTGTTITKDLNEIRQFLTYSEDNDPAAARPYLAVKRARIYCTFPHAEVENLTLMDLPGLGEVSLDIEDLHAQDLRRDVDLVLLVKRAEQGMGFWKESDSQTLEILKKAKGHVESIYDYMFVVNNAGGLDPKAVSDMMNHIQHNYGGYSRTTFLTWNSINSASEEVLVPTLRHLAERLPTMDEQVFRGAMESTAKIRRQLQNQLGKLQEALRDAIPVSQNENEAIRDKTRRIRFKIAKTLRDYREELDSSKATEEYKKRLSEITSELTRSLKDGLGLGTNKWLEKCDMFNILEEGRGKFIHDEMNRIRNMIAVDFFQLDHNITHHLMTMRFKVAEILQENFKGMMEDDVSSQTLEKLVKKLKFSEVTCPHTIKTIEDLLEAKVTYRTHLLQYVRPRLVDFVWESQIEKILKGAKGKGQRNQNIMKALVGISCDVVDQIQKELEKQSTLASDVIQALFDEFRDQLIRAKDSEVEFERIVHHFRLEIDEEYFSSIKRSNYRVDQIHKSIQKLHQAIEFA